MLSIEEIERKHWDYLVIGTGIGGATAGHALAKGGKNVLFLEKGRAPFLHTDALQGTYPESLFSYGEATSLRNAPLLARTGRCYEEIQDLPTSSHGDTFPTGAPRRYLKHGLCTTRIWRPITSKQNDSIEYGVVETPCAPMNLNCPHPHRSALKTRNCTRTFRNGD